MHRFALLLNMKVIVNILMGEGFSCHSLLLLYFPCVWTLRCVYPRFTSGMKQGKIVMGGNKQTGLRQWATPLSASGRPEWHGRPPTAIYFIPWHRYLPPGSFAMAIVSQSEVFSPRRVYERVAKWYYFLAQLVSSGNSFFWEPNGVWGKKEAYHSWEPWTQH